MNGRFVAFLFSALACALNTAVYAADTSRSVALVCAIVNGMVALFFAAYMVAHD